MPPRARIAHPWGLLLATVCAGSTAVLGGAPRPLPELTPEEIELRRLVQPLRDGLHEGKELQPLRAWLDARRAAGKEREAERELRRVLERIHDEYNRDLRRAAEWVRRLQVQRSRLYHELAEENASLAGTLKDYRESPPVPVIEELLPGHDGLPDEFLSDLDLDFERSPGQAAGTALVSSVSTDPPGADLVEPDKAQLLNRITLDLTALGHVMHQCDNEYEDERDRHRTAVAALKLFLQVRHGERTRSQ